MLQLQQLMHKTLIGVIGVIALSFGSVAMAELDALDGVAKPKGDKCSIPGEESEIRAHHFQYILHQRDKTMHQGVRTKDSSLKECINCHVPENTSVRFGDDKHFCSACHKQAGVTIDCFQCHADRPGQIPGIHKQAMAELETKLNAEVTATPGTEPSVTGAAQ
ncbi:MAG: hypothetical protein HYZ31_07725 [Gammaproteobacteria bacterium]|nr:hypothetical protein [Gammaproteobacteria bacterium]